MRLLLQFVIVKKKQIDVSSSCVCSVIGKEFRDNIVKVVSGSTRVSPKFMIQITGQAHENLPSIC